MESWNNSYQTSKKFWEVEKGRKKQGANFQINMESCQFEEKGKACNIQFDKDSPFQWKKEFQPKAIVSTVSR